MIYYHKQKVKTFLKYYKNRKRFRRIFFTVYRAEYPEYESGQYDGVAKKQISTTTYEEAAPEISDSLLDEFSIYKESELAYGSYIRLFSQKTSQTDIFWSITDISLWSFFCYNGNE